MQSFNMSKFRHVASSCTRSIVNRLNHERLSSTSLNFAVNLPRRSLATQSQDGTSTAIASPVTKASKFKLPQHHPNKLDRITLVATRTMKEHEIGNEVSFEMMEKANTRRRIGVNISLMIFTLLGSIWAVWQGKKEMKTNNIYEINKRR